MSTRAGASSPRPGALHVASASSGGFSGRPRMFVLGLDEGRFPGAGMQDPVLLDAERVILNRALGGDVLGLAPDAIARREAELQSCLGRATGQVTLSSSCRDLLQGRDQFPAAVLLGIHRSISGKTESTFEELITALGQPEGFVPSDGRWLNETEWRLHHCLRQRAGSGTVLARFPWLKDGLDAREQRAGDRFTVFDGNLGPDVKELHPTATGTLVSPTRLERLAKCPFNYFLGDVLGVKAPQDLALDRSQWLDALQFGSLVHEVLREFMTSLMREKRRPAFDHDWPALERLARQSLERVRQEVPPSGDAAFNARRGDLILLCRTFLKHEEGWCQKARPRFFELSFGEVRVDDGATAVAAEGKEVAGAPSAGPVRIPLADGQELLLQGRIDRVDELDAGGFVVWDYKTGSAAPFNEVRSLDRGRQLQHALYAMAVEQVLRRTQGTAEVVQSGYFLPGSKGRGLAIVFKPDPAAATQVLERLLGIMRAGAFLPVGEPEMCRYCDFAKVCGEAGVVGVRAKAKIDSMVGGPADALSDWRMLKDL